MPHNNFGQGVRHRLRAMLSYTVQAEGCNSMATLTRAGDMPVVTGGGVLKKRASTFAVLVRRARAIVYFSSANNVSSLAQQAEA